MTEGTLEVGWGSPQRALHVSADGIQQGVPASFQKSMKKGYADRKIWIDSYIEEVLGLTTHNTFGKISFEEYRRKYAHIKILPSMCVQTIKKDERGIPVRAKSRIVALGNHEDRIWEKSEVYAPVLVDTTARFMTSLAVEHGRIEKQGDAKNAFCNGILPKDETVIVSPPPGCPLSQKGELWILYKTLYGLRRSPIHWYQTIRKHLTDIGFCGEKMELLSPLYMSLGRY